MVEHSPQILASEEKATTATILAFDIVAHRDLAQLVQFINRSGSPQHEA